MGRVRAIGGVVRRRLDLDRVRRERDARNSDHGQRRRHREQGPHRIVAGDADRRAVGAADELSSAEVDSEIRRAVRGNHPGVRSHGHELGSLDESREPRAVFTLDVVEAVLGAGQIRPSPIVHREEGVGGDAPRPRIDRVLVEVVPAVRAVRRSTSAAPDGSPPRARLPRARAAAGSRCWSRCRRWRSPGDCSPDDRRAGRPGTGGPHGSNGNGGPISRFHDEIAGS